MAPGGVTHHLRFLEAAGLIWRERTGRSVTVELTARGGAILALYRRGTWHRADCGDGVEPAGARPR
jgi:DNA-binding MarR family transcriptional regulator